MSLEKTTLLIQVSKSLCAAAVLSSFLFFSACSTYQAGQTDQAAAVGAVIGGGLGAAAGSQSGGGAITGLSLGAIAGAGIGSYVGDRFERDSNSLTAQQETIHRQQREIQQKQSEIEDLRRMGQDQVAFRQPSAPQYGSIREGDLMAAPAPAIRHHVESVENHYVETVDNNVVILDNQIVEEIQTGEGRAAYDWKGQTATMTPECKEAQDESTKATGTEELAEQLYHYRRALRLCPEQAEFHIGISKVYLKLDRFEDAKYELEEALRLDPSDVEAQAMMRTL